MECPKCGSERSKVVDSRKVPNAFLQGSISRRRECCECKTRFTTYEVRKDYLTPEDED